MEEPFGMEDHSDGEPTFSVDPVCGQPVNEAEAAGKTGYAGQMYYFCSVECKMQFEQSPASFMGQRRAGGG
jgi:YHS domain-containing protein